MIRAIGRGAWRRLLILPPVLVFAVACAGPIQGQASGAPVPVLSASQTVEQSLVNLAEAGVVHYRGSLTNPNGKQIGIDASVTATGEAGGSLSVDGQQGSLVVVNGALYVDAPAQFWALLSGDPGSESDAVDSRWVKVPSVTIGLDIGVLLRPAGLAEFLARQVDASVDAPLSGEPVTKIGNAQALEIGLTTATVDIDATGTHGVLRVEAPTVSTATNLSLDIADVSASEAGVYQSLNQQAGQLRTAVDTSVDIQQGNQNWGTCTAAACSVVVSFTNGGSVATKVVVAGKWTGDNAPAGTCQVIVGPVAAGASATAACVNSTPQWTSFFDTAHATPGDHPYQVDWTAEALAAPPNLGTLAGETTAAGTPATTNPQHTAGVAYVYVIDYQNAAKQAQVWKYGVSDNPDWRSMAEGELAACRSSSRTSCAVGLVGATANRPSADALVASLVAKATGPKGCPPGQWVDCQPH